MGTLGTVMDSIVGVFRGIGVALAVILGLVAWVSPLGMAMLPETKFVLLTVVMAVVYDDVVKDDGENYGPADLALTGALSYGTLMVVSR